MLRAIGEHAFEDRQRVDIAGLPEAVGELMPQQRARVGEACAVSRRASAVDAPRPIMSMARCDPTARSVNRARNRFASGTWPDALSSVRSRPSSSASVVVGLSIVGARRRRAKISRWKGGWGARGATAVQRAARETGATRPASLPDDPDLAFSRSRSRSPAFVSWALPRSRTAQSRSPCAATLRDDLAG